MQKHRVDSTSRARALSQLGAFVVSGGRIRHSTHARPVALSDVCAQDSQQHSADTAAEQQECSADSTSRARALSQPYISGSQAAEPRQSSTSRARALSLLSALLTVMVAFTLIAPAAQVNAATSDELNFQGRLLTNTGGLVPDGTYNMEFNLYYVSSGGSAVWTEDRLNTNTEGVTVRNGYFSVYLGEYDAFGAIDWSEDLYLGLTVRGTGSAAWGSLSPADGEMTPRFKLTSVPYAFRAANVASSDTDSADSDDVSITTGDTTTSGDSGDIIVDNGVGATANGSISIGTTNASSVLIGRAGTTTTIQGSVALTGAGTALTVTNDAVFNGNTTIGNATSDTLTVEADATFNGTLTVSTGDVFQNAGATLFSATSISDRATGGNIGTAATTVDVATTFDVNQTTAGQTLTLPDPTNTASGRVVYVNNIGSQNFTMYGETIETGSSSTFIWNGSSWTTSVSFSNTGVDTIGALDGGVANANGAEISGTTLYLQSASATQPGLINTTSQAFAGVKTFNDEIIASGGLTVSAGENFVNQGSTLFDSIAIADVAAGGNIGTAATTVDVATTFDVNQTTAGQTLTLPNPTTATSGRIAFVNNVGSASFTMYGSVIAAGQSNTFIWNGSTWITTVSLSGSVVNTIGTIDSQTKSADGAVISANAIYLQTADIDDVGLVSIGNQTFNGVKTFDDGIVVTTGGATITAGDLAVTAGDISTNGTVRLSNAGALSNITGYSQNSGNFAIAGTGTFSTGTGTVSLNGATSVTGTNTFTVGTGVTSLGGTLGVTGAATFDGNVTIGDAVGDTFTVNAGSIQFANNFTSCTVINTDASGVLGCDTATYLTSANAFVQGGNDFSGTAVLGTSAATGDALQLITDGTTALTIDTSQNATFAGLITGQNGLTVTGTTSINTTGTAVTTIGNSGAVTTIDGSVLSLGTTGANVVTLGNASSSVVSVISGGITAITGTTSITGLTSGDALTVSNSTSTGNILVLEDDSTPVLTVANGGAVTVQNTVDSTAGFQVLDADGGTAILTVDTQNERVGIGTSAPVAGFEVATDVSVASNRALKWNAYYNGANDVYLANGSAVQQWQDETADFYRFYAAAAGTAGNPVAFQEAFAIDLNSASLGDVTFDSGTLYVDASADTVTAGGALVVDGNTTLGDASGDSLTVNAGSIQFANNFASCTAINTDASGNLGCDTSAYLTSTNAFVQNGNTFGATAVLGTDDAYGLSFETSDTERLAIEASGSVIVSSGNLLVGNGGTAGLLRISDGSSNTVSIDVQALAGDYTVSVPTITANDTFCLQGLNNCASLNPNLTDNITDALDIQEGTNNYININTTNSSENISFGNATTNPDYSFLGSGDFTVAGVSTFNNTVTVNGGTITDTGAAQSISVTLGNDGNVDLVSALSISATSAATGDADGLIGIYLQDLAGDNATVGETAILVGNNWDTALTLQDTDARIAVADVLRITDISGGSGNSLLTIDVNGTVGDVGVTGALQVAGLTTLNGGLTIEAGDTFNFNSDAFSDFTGGGLYNNAGVLSVTNTGASGFFQNGGNSFGVATTIGTNDAQSLGVETGGTTRFTVSASASTLTGNGATTIIGGTSLYLGTTGANSLTLATNGNTRFTVANNASTLTGNGATSLIGGSTLTLNAAAASALNLGTTQTSGVITIGGTGAATGTINLGTGTGAQAINLGTGGTGAKTVTVGSTASTSSATLRSGSGGIALQAGTGAVSISGTVPNSAQGSLTTISGTSTGTSDQVSGLLVGTTFNPSGSSDIDVAGIISSPINSNGNLNGGDATLIGVSGIPQFTGAGSIDGLIGFAGTTINSGGGTVGVAMGAQFLNAVNSGTITRNIGINIDNQTSGANNTNLFIGGTTAPLGNYSIYNSSAYANYFAGNLGIASTGAANKLSVNTLSFADADAQVAVSTGGTSNVGLIIQRVAGQTANLLELQRDDGSNLVSINQNGSGYFAGTLEIGGLTTLNGGLTVEAGDTFTFNSDAFTDFTGGGLVNTGGVLSVDTTSASGFFQNGGNSFGGTATLGTNDANSLVFEVGGVDALTIADGGAITVQNETNSFDAFRINNTSGDYAFYVNTVTNNTNIANQLNIEGTPGSGNDAVLRLVTDPDGNNYFWDFTVEEATGDLVFDSSGSDLLTITENGAATFQNSLNSTAAFRVNTSGGTSLLNIDTTNELVTVKSTVFDAAAVQAFTGSGNITQSNIDGYGTILISSDAAGYTATLQDPTSATAGRLVYVTNTGSFDMTLAANSGGSLQEVTLKPNTSATMVWNGSDWTAAGASSSTDLQAAYNNTATSAGGAELILNAPGGAADGLTVRNNATTPITGGLLEIQTSIGSNLFSVNNNATEFASNGGAETAGASAAAFPASTWSAPPTGGTVSRFTTTGDNVATGQASVQVVTAGTDDGAANQLASALTPNLKYTVSFTARGLTNFTSLEVVYSRDGTNSSTTACTTGETVTSGQWTRITCTFAAPSSGITSANEIFIRQTDGTARTFYIDNLSVNINASATYAADGSVDNSGAFGTNWTNFDGGAGSSVVTEETSVIYDTSASAEVATSANANQGIRNNLAIDPATDTQYLVSFYARTDTTMSGSLAVGFLPTGGTSTPSGSAACTDYNTQSLTAGVWTKITCLFTTTGTTVTNPDLVIYQTDSTARSIFIDALSITLNTNNSNNVQVGGGNLGGPVTLFTLDRSAGNPIADNNEAYLGSMYYDTITGRIQCYEADGWGACGAAPDNVVNLNPEYAGAVLNGSGVGTMTADFCSNDVDLSVNSTFCGSGEAKNFYNWTSPQATEQTYSIYVTYQLPETFNGFSSDDTVQLVGRVDNTSNASVTYEMFRSTGSDVSQCGTGETDVITGGGGSADTWYSYGINGNESTGCGLNAAAAGDFIIFKINLKAQSNANAYVSTLSFVTTGR